MNDTFSGTGANAEEIGHTPSALLVFSHLRWNFVTQRPQHLLKRAARSRPVYFWEEPLTYPVTPPPWARHWRSWKATRLGGGQGPRSAPAPSSIR